MKVFIITKVSFPYGWAATNRIKCLAKSFIEGGADCRVVVFGRNSSKETVAAKGIFEGIPYEYIGSSTIRKSGNIRGRLQAFGLQIHLLFYLAKNLCKGDYVCSYINKNNFFRRVLISLTHWRKSFFISELCELPYGTGKETDDAKKGRKYEFDKLFPLYDGVIAISDALKDLAGNYCSPRCVIAKVPILVEFEKYDMPDKSKEADYPYIFHSGTLYEQKDGILGMIEAFGLAHKKLSIPPHFILTGQKESSPHCREIEKLIKQYRIEDYVHFVGYLSHEELKDTLSKASLVIINKYPTQQNIYCFSTKLGEYLAAGKPTIITNVGEAMNWLTDKEDCVVVEPNNVDVLSDAIVEAFNHPEEMSRLGDNARQTCRRAFDYRSHVSVLKKMLNQIVENN